MRRILGYIDGKAQWSDNEPGGYARTSGHGGELVKSTSDAESRQRELARATRENRQQAHNRGRHQEPVADCPKCAA